jgi:DNA-binding transcriptional ArsR family regulator
MNLAIDKAKWYVELMTIDAACATTDHEAPAPRPRAPATVRQRAARMLRAAGDADRLALLELLDAGELCVTDLAALTGDAMPTVSQRLRQLKTEGLATTRRDGKHVFYALADEHVRELLHNILHHAAETAGSR